MVLEGRMRNFDSEEKNMKFLELDSPLMQGLNKLGDLLWLNVLTLVCCIPIVTIGPSLTAMHYIALKIARNEEGYITRDFFKSFRRNLKQGIIIGLILIFVLVVMAGDFLIINYSGLEFNGIIRSILLAIFFLVMFAAMFVFPVLAKFDNTVFNTIKNAFLIGIAQLPKTILMMVLFAVPPLLFVFVPQIIPIVFMFGLSLPAWASAKLYNKYFRKLEEQIMGKNAPEETEGGAEEAEDERIFKDELDSALQDDSHIN